MKKLMLFFGLVFGIASLMAQSKVKGNGVVKEETRDVSNYHSVKLKGSFDVILTDEEQGKIRVVAEENIIPLIQAKLSNKELELSFKPKISVSYKKAKVYVPAQNIEKISLVGSGDIENQGNMSAKNLIIQLLGSGEIDLKNINAEKVEAILKGSGDIDLKGVAKELSVSLKGSGNVSAFGLKTEKSVVEVVGSGDVEVYSTKEFTGKLSGSGDIKVKGNPAKISKIKKGSSTISILK